MGVRILYDADQDQAVLYCSTSDWAFGPVFYKGEHRPPGVTEDSWPVGKPDADGRYRWACVPNAYDRAEAFLAWLDGPADYAKYEKTQIGERRDARLLTESGLQAAYSDWLAHERTLRLTPFADDDDSVPA